MYGNLTRKGCREEQNSFQVIFPTRYKALFSRVLASPNLNDVRCFNVKEYFCPLGLQYGKNLFSVVDNKIQKYIIFFAISNYIVVYFI